MLIFLKSIPVQPIQMRFKSGFVALESIIGLSIILVVMLGFASFMGYAGSAGVSIKRKLHVIGSAYSFLYCQQDPREAVQQEEASVVIFDRSGKKLIQTIVSVEVLHAGMRQSSSAVFIRQPRFSSS